MNAMPKATNAVTAIFFILAGLNFFGVEFPFMKELAGIAGLLGGAGNIVSLFTGNSKKK
ncbi:MAG: hypothetical protein JW704_04250 [Anaerolineaceae bacterium]|nr:hypothetical protein [Anaerolineaceae bacterium]MBN2677490.1 hypothetical protein [Anaerolineaceae bacterium]